MSGDQKESLDRVAVSSEKAARPMTDKEEFYVGRAVAATLLSRYRLYPDEALARYVNEVAQTVALASDRPLTYGGYHLAVLDAEEENALSCPGGMIFITRGMLKKARNEDELAAILAHEIAHVNHKDGVAAIKKSRWVEVATLMGTEATRQFGGADLTQLVSLFEGSVDDVVKTLVVNGYSREQESAADLSALTFLDRAGYDPNALTDCLARIAGEETAGTSGRGIFATHPGMSNRVATARQIITQKGWKPGKHPARDERFRQYAKPKP
jgi:predicted Zn-dependent protease